MKSSPNGKEKDMDITSYVKAGYPLIYVCTQEADRATRSIKADGWKTYSWHCLRLDATIARMLSYRFEKIRVYKFPEELFSQFKQIVLFGVCKKTPFPDEKTC